MTKVVIDVRDDRTWNHGAFVKSIIVGVVKGLLEIVIPTYAPRTQYTTKWFRSVDTGKWVKVWVPER